MVQMYQFKTITPIKELLFNTNIRPVDQIAIQQEYEYYWLMIAIRNQGTGVVAMISSNDCDTFYRIAIPMYKELLQRMIEEAETNVFVRPACDFVFSVIIRTILIYRLVEHHYRARINQLNRFSLPSILNKSQAMGNRYIIDLWNSERSATCPDSPGDIITT